MPAAREEMDKCEARSDALHKWFRLIRKTEPEETWIDLLFARLATAEYADERSELRSLLTPYLNLAGRYTEALQLADDEIAEKPGEVFGYTGKACVYHTSLHDFESALACLDLALECARRSGNGLRMTLGHKARVLVAKGDGDALVRVLEEIMAAKVTRDAPDIGRERDFVDAAPSGLIPVDVFARYDAFCPKRDGDTPDEMATFDQPEWGRDGEEIPVTRARWRP